MKRDNKGRFVKGSNKGFIPWNKGLDTPQTGRKGRVPWNKGKKGAQIAWNKSKPIEKLTFIFEGELCIKIPLTQDVFAIINEEDFEIVNKYHWYASKNKYTHYVYGKVYATGKKHICVKLHRILTNCPKNMEVDHINGNGLDNRRENLRVVTHKENMINRHLYTS